MSGRDGLKVSPTDWDDCPAAQDLLILVWNLGRVMEKTVEEPGSLVLFKNSVQAALREVQVDVRAFKKQMEDKLEEVCVSSRPLAAAVGRLQEENLQLRAQLEALSHLVEQLTGAKPDHSPTGGNRRNLENGQTQNQDPVQRVGPKSSPSTVPQAPESGGGGSIPAPPPWRTRRAAETNVSILAGVVYWLVIMETVS